MSSEDIIEGEKPLKVKNEETDCRLKSVVYEVFFEVCLLDSNSATVLLKLSDLIR